MQQRISIFQVDSFTDTVFKGNPAAVCPLMEWLDDSTLQNIAIENNLAETAFFVKTGMGHYKLRWFMPHGEIDLCGHATLASAWVILFELHSEWNKVTFDSLSGPLVASKCSNGCIELDFPSAKPILHQDPDEIKKVLAQAFSLTPKEIYTSRDLILIYEKEEQIRNMKPNLDILKNLPYLCTVISAPGQNVDFVSRVFDANAPTMQEDPVTGSVHCSLAPIWSHKLKKKELTAVQLSERTGYLHCEIKGDRICLRGHAVLYLKGEIII
uniref:Uncharacterized protein n=1 Tax=Lepeophtheirus salmonis TaxID=72036 RepID=A0A0K2UDH4_LEPSM